MLYLGDFIKKLFKKNIIFTLVLIGVLSYQIIQANKIKEALKNTSLSHYNLYSIEQNKTLSIKEIKSNSKIIYLWATWCPPCRLQNQILDFYHLIGIINKDEIIKISLDQDLKLLKNYLKESSLKNHYLDHTNQFFSKEIIRGTPTILKIDEEGKIINFKMGISFIF